MPRQTVSKWLALALAGAMVFALAACGGDPAGESQTSGPKEDLVAILSSEPLTMNPIDNSELNTANVLTQMFENLVDFDENMEIQPQLAESWEQVDDITMRFHLRQGVKFHNGEEMKASDVVFSIKRMAESPKLKHVGGIIDPTRIIAEDDYTVTIGTYNPAPTLLANLTYYGAHIMSEKAVAEQGDNVSREAIGTGPFKFVEWASGDHLTMERFDDYWGEKAKIKTLTFKFITESANRVIELETGGADYVTSVPIADIDRVAENPNFSFLKKAGLGITYFGPNCEKEPFDDPLVRQAFAYAIDVPLIRDTVWGEGGGEVVSVLPPAETEYYNDQVNRYEYNPDKARELLAQAGLPDGFSFEILTSGSSIEYVRAAEIAQNMLSEVGITMEIKQLESAALTQAMNNKEHQMIIYGLNSATGDPDVTMYKAFHSSTHGSGGNRVCYSDPEVDARLDAARVEMDHETRVAMYKELQEMLIDDCAWIPVVNTNILTAGVANLKGVIVTPMQKILFKNAYFE